MEVKESEIFHWNIMKPEKKSHSLPLFQLLKKHIERKLGPGGSIKVGNKLD